MSRQFAHFQRQTLERLRTMADPFPLLVTIAASGQGFEVHRLDDPAGTVLIAGRFQVVAAYLAGFTAGRLAD